MAAEVQPLRAGSVPYLNAAPLVHGLQGRIRLEPPSRLAESLRRGEIDAALLSITEALFRDEYEVLDGACVASDGDVFSVLLAHRVPLGEIRVVRCHSASLTSVNLLRVLLAERGLFPAFESFEPTEIPIHEDARTATLLIGDPAIRFRLSGLAERHGAAIWDLGQAWQEVTGLPFVYATWVLRRGVETRELRRELAEAARRGEVRIEDVIRNGTEFSESFRREYLTRHTHHRLGDREKAGIRRFVEFLRRHGHPEAREPGYVT